MRVDPISCLRPKPEVAGRFAAPPYDVFDDSQGRAYAASHPGSFFDIDRPETAFPAGHDPYAPEVYAHAAALLEERVADGTLVRDARPSLFAYRLELGGHGQTGVVGAVAAAEYLDGTIRRHEQVREEKVSDRVRHITATAHQTGPVLLTYADSDGVDALVGQACAQAPLYDFVDDAGVRHTVWGIADAQALSEAFAGVSHAYIADGHHRAAAAVRLSQERHAADDWSGEVDDADSFLAILYPASQMQVLAYNRVVADTRGLDEDGLVQALVTRGVEVGERLPGAVSPVRERQIGMYAFGAWRELRLPEPALGSDPAASLDVAILQDRVLAPVLGIADPTADGRIAFVSGVEGADGLERLAGREGLAFSLHPTAVADLMAVSDAGLLMPPKSTWFAPKPASGLFLRGI